MPLRCRILLAVVACWCGAWSAYCAAAADTQVTSYSVGFADHYRLGGWVPLRCQIHGGDEPAEVTISAVAPDSDGLAVSYSTPPNEPISVLPGQDRNVELLIRVGQTDATILLTLHEGSKRPRTIKLNPFQPLEQGGITGGDATTTRHILHVGPTAIDLGKPFAEEGTDLATSTRVSHVSDFGSLPRRWLGYETIDTVVLTTAGETALTTVRASDVRIQALTEWVEMGGRLVIAVGENAPTLLASEGPLADLVPGEFTSIATLDDPAGLEQYAGATVPIGSRGTTQITVARLANPAGQVLAEAEDASTELPLVISARRGLGRVTVVTCDLDRSPLRQWKGLPLLERKLLDMAAPRQQEQQGPYYDMWNRDMSDLMVQKLDEQLATQGVRTTPFIAIVGLVVLYIALIGPFDYWLVKYVFKRMEATWITFPLIVVGTCVGAYALAHYVKGDEQRINSIEILDIDTSTGLARGTMWHHLFSPRPERLDLELAALDSTGAEAAVDDVAVAWLGQTGNGLGRMNQSASSSPFGQSGYTISADRRHLSGRPVQIWSTRTSTARWRAQDRGPVSSELTTADDEIAEGVISNITADKLFDCRLYYGGWVWRMGDLDAGAVSTINSSRPPISIATLLKTEYSVDDTDLNNLLRYRLSDRVALNRLVELAMMAHAFEFERVTSFVNRYQQFVDVSHVAQPDTAIMIAESRSPRSQLVAPGTDSNAVRPSGASLVMYRMLLPVERVAQP